jgi:hypothetical protein
VVKCLLCKCEALSSNPSPTHTKKSSPVNSASLLTSSALGLEEPLLAR